MVERGSLCGGGSSTAWATLLMVVLGVASAVALPGAAIPNAPAQATAAAAWACGTVTLSPSLLPCASRGDLYEQGLAAGGGTAPWSFSVTGGSLPPGLSLGEGGVLSGTPSEIGAYAFTVTVTDVLGCTGCQDFDLSVSGPVALSMTRVDADLLLSWTSEAPPYAVYRSTDCTQVYAGSPLATTASTTYTDTSAPAADLVCYGVRGCAASPLAAPLFLDPPVAYGGIATPAVLHLWGAAEQVGQIRLLRAGSTPVAPAFGSAGGKLLLTVPASMTAGAWTLELTDTGGTVSVLKGALAVTASPTLELGAVSPPFASPSLGASVTLTGPGGFLFSPRAYLSASGGGSSAVALETTFGDTSTLTAQVPGGLTAGSYDVVVVNPDGTSGVLSAAFTVLASEPPMLASVAPDVIVSSGGSLITLRGDHFDPSSVSIRCLDPTGTTSVTAGGTLVSAAPTEAAVLFGYPPPAGYTCVMRLTNADGSYAEYSGLAVAPATLNPGSWRGDTHALPAARRALALAAGRSSPDRLHLYAVGGDGGATSGAVRSVTTAEVGPHGSLLGGWSILEDLPAARTFSGVATVGRFLYLVGGHDGAGPVATVYRAQILDPAGAPLLSDHDLSPPPCPSGLGAGQWYYQVSALFSGSDASNPGGESLPSLPRAVQVPGSPGAQVTLRWTSVPGASGYRVYRSPAAGDPHPHLIASVSGGLTTTFSDSGVAATSDAPLAEGALGRWHLVAALACARQAPAVVAAPSPTDSAKTFLYVFGGTDTSGIYRSDLEYLPITTAGDGSQSVAAPSVGTAVMASPRAEMDAWLVRSTDSTGVPSGESWLYVGPGRTGASSYTSFLEAAEVTTSGDLAALAYVGGPPGGRCGSAGYVGAQHLFLWGGVGGNAGVTGSGGDLCSATSGTCPPDISGWSTVLPTGTARIYAGRAQDRAFYFLVGGYDGAAVLSSVERNVK